jgi:hypothetical protein
MSSTFFDANVPRCHGSPQEAPRGLVRPPEEIKAWVAQEQARLQPYYTDAYAKLILDDMTLAYYYEGVNVAYRSVPEGVEILAVGNEEIGRFHRNTPPEQLEDVDTKMP